MQSKCGNILGYNLDKPTATENFENVEILKIVCPNLTHPNFARQSEFCLWEYQHFWIGVIN